MKLLYVYYENQLVGELTQDDELVFGFRYAESWRSNASAFPLSLALPLQQEAFGNRATLSFFENLLPEGDVKENLERTQGVSGVFDFLKNYGEDCAGAVVVTDQRDFVPDLDPSKVVPVDMGKVYAAIDDRTSVADVIASMNHGYLSLAGAQDKFPAILADGQFWIPTHGAATTHIVKCPIQHSGIKESVINEYYCMELARALNFNVPPCHVLDGPHALFVIERYDRYRDAQGIVRRIHQQDFCQAQGRTSEYKYEDKGGPSLKDNYLLVTNHTPPLKRVASIQAFLDWVCFNLIIGNHDGHSKNISFVLRNARNELAPFYDLLCTAIYPKLTRNFSFKIGDRTEFSKIGAHQIKILEESLGLKEGAFRNRLLRINREIHQHKDRLAKRICEAFPGAKIPWRISKLIEERSKSLHLQGAI